MTIASDYIKGIRNWKSVVNDVEETEHKDFWLFDDVLLEASAYRFKDGSVLVIHDNGTMQEE